MNAVGCSLDIIKELGITLSKVDPASSIDLKNAILDARRIFVAGAGRSGFMLRGAAMRLMHMGLTVYLVGETTTPNIQKGDLLLIGSGSGETASLLSMAKKAKALGATLALVTILPESSIAALADVIVCIPAPTSKSEKTMRFASIQPMGSLFEQCLLLFLDATILCLMEDKKIDAEAMFSRHANLE